MAQAEQLLLKKFFFTKNIKQNSKPLHDTLGKFAIKTKRSWYFNNWSANKMKENNFTKKMVPNDICAEEQAYISECFKSALINMPNFDPITNLLNFTVNFPM